MKFGQSGDDLIPRKTEDRGTQELFRLGVDDQPDQAGGLALFLGAADALHRQVRNQDAATLGHQRQRLGTGQPNPAQGRISEHGIGGDAGVRALPLVQAGQIVTVSQHDFMVVIGGVRKGTAPIDVPKAQMPGTFVFSRASVAI